jgi:hypothetical protein
MRFIAIRDFKTGSDGPFQLTKLSIEAPIEQPEGNQVDISGLGEVALGIGSLFQSDDELKNFIAATLDIPVANVELR